MNDTDKTSEQLLAELAALRQRNAALEAAEAERRQMEDALRESEERYRVVEEALHKSAAHLQAIFNSSPQSILLVDRHRTIQAFNPKANERARVVLGKEIHEGDSIYALVPKDGLEAFNQHFDAALQGQSIKVERNFRGIGGADNWIEARYDPVFTDKGAISGVYLSITNTTDRVQAEAERTRLEEQILQARKMGAIGSLAGGIAHDFNNILAAIMGYTELASYDLPRDSAPGHHLQEVLSAVHRAKALVQQILTFSRQTKHERKAVRLHLLVQEALTLLRASLPTTIEIRQQLAQNAGAILADATQIHQVLMNLCANAEQAMRETGGILEVRVDNVEVDAVFATRQAVLCPGPYVRLTVRDTGPGIAPEILPRIFEPFFTTKAVGQGTGMGLTVVHGIVTNHRGVITVQSTLGKGTTFAIYLPQIEAPADGETHTEEPITYGRGRVLFVDDEEALAHLGQTMLVRLGYDVVVRTSSVEALEVFRAIPQCFDAVITDQTMPSMTGEQLARELRRIRPDIPIILCTGFSHVMNTEKALALGIDRFLMKPLGTQELGIALQQVLAPRSRQGAPPG